MKQSEIRHYMKREFRAGIEQKVIMVEPQASRDHLERAIQFANKLSDPSFWPKLIGYRLAHLIMRDARTEDEFKYVLELLNLESDKRFPHLEFTTGILSVAAVFRLSQLSQQNFDERIEGLISRLSTLLASRNLESKISNVEQYPLQDLHHNMLELAAYFTGSLRNTYDLLPQSSRVMHNQRGQISWRIILPSGEPDGLYYDRELAEHEMSSLLKTNPGGSSLVLGPDNECVFYFRGELIKEFKVQYGQVLNNLIFGGGSVRADALSPASDKTRRRYVKAINDATVPDLITYDSSLHRWKLSMEEEIFVMRFGI